MKDLDGAIEHCMEIAEENELKCSLLNCPGYSNYGDANKCLACAAEHRQLAGWLKELKRYKELSKQIADFKKSVKSENSDYLTGYLCALSVVEGMMAEVEGTA